MNILLIDADYNDKRPQKHTKKRFPNLALAKISSYHKGKGDTVFLNEANGHRIDKVYVSCVFTWNLKEIKLIKEKYKCPVVCGGGALGVNHLYCSMDHIMPDYELYGIEASMGYHTRGCIRRCGFCKVWKLEPYFTFNAPLSEFLHPDHNRLILLDNNLLAWKDVVSDLEYIRDADLWANFNQGLDIRLVSEEIAGLLADIKYYNWTFSARKLYFAWDIMDYEKQFMRGIHRLTAAGIKPYRIMVYILCGYDTDFSMDMYRFKKLIKLGVEPYVMVYNNRQDNEQLKKFKRYVNNRVYKSKTCPTFESYDRRLFG